MNIFMSLTTIITFQRICSTTYMPHTTPSQRAALAHKSLKKLIGHPNPYPGEVDSQIQAQGSRKVLS